MYKCEICGSRTCPACLDCKSLGNRKTGFYCNRYKVRLTALNQTGPYHSTIEQLHDGARACNQCIIDRAELLTELTPTLEVATEDDEEPFVPEEREYIVDVPLPTFEGTPVGITRRPSTATTYTTTTTANTRITAADVRRAIAALQEIPDAERGHSLFTPPPTLPPPEYDGTVQRETDEGLMATLALQNDGTTMQPLEERVFVEHLMQHVRENEARRANTCTTNTAASTYIATTAYAANPSTITASSGSDASIWWGDPELEN